MQEVLRCEGDNVSLRIQKDFKRLKGEDYGTNISNGRFKPASAKHSSNVKDEFIEFLINLIRRCYLNCVMLLPYTGWDCRGGLGVRLLLQ